jgi:chloramphenicol O-acetyltransferase type A
MGETEIDLATWERRAHFEMYRAVDFPHFSLTAPITVTPLLATARARKLSLFNAMLFCILRAANSLPEFRLRFRGARVLRHDVVHPSFTVPIEGDRFAFCQAEYHEDWEAFDTACRAAIDAARQQTTLNIETAGEDHWIYLSCLPWLDFSAMTHPLQNKDDCIPRIAWGKIIEETGRARVSVNLQAHHAIMDGLHAARFFQEVQKNADEFQLSS